MWLHASSHRPRPPSPRKKDGGTEGHEGGWTKGGRERKEEVLSLPVSFPLRYSRLHVGSSSSGFTCFVLHALVFTLSTSGPPLFACFCLYLFCEFNENVLASVGTRLLWNVSSFFVDSAFKTFFWCFLTFFNCIEISIWVITSWGGSLPTDACHRSDSHARHQQFCFTDKISTQKLIHCASCFMIPKWVIYIVQEASSISRYAEAPVQRWDQPGVVGTGVESHDCLLRHAGHLKLNPGFHWTAGGGWRSFVPHSW